MATSFKVGFTRNAMFDKIASGSLAGAGTSSVNVDLSGVGATGVGSSTTGAFEGSFLISNTPGASVSGTAGLQVQAFEGFGTTPTFATIPTQTLIIPSVASTLASATMRLGPGIWKILLTNLDASNAVTVGVTSNTVDSVTG